MCLVSITIASFAFSSTPLGCIIITYVVDSGFVYLGFRPWRRKLYRQRPQHKTKNVRMTDNTTYRLPMTKLVELLSPSFHVGHVVPYWCGVPNPSLCTWCVSPRRDTITSVTALSTQHITLRMFVRCLFTNSEFDDGVGRSFTLPSCCHVVLRFIVCVLIQLKMACPHVSARIYASQSMLLRTSFSTIGGRFSRLQYSIAKQT